MCGGGTNKCGAMFFSAFSWRSVLELHGTRRAEIARKVAGVT